MEKLYYSYEDFRKDVLALLPKLQNHYDTLIGISRGGLTLTQALAEALDIRNVQTLRTISYDTTQKRDDFLLIDNTDLHLSKKVLIVDDISDSGETLLKVMRYLTTKYPKTTFETVTLFYKETSLYKPTFYANISTQWINFFWEVDFIKKSS